MKNVLYFLLGIFLITLTSAATVSVMTVKPAKPKTFIVKNFKYEYNADEVEIYIKARLKEGWILKEAEAANSGGHDACWIVVMEKY